MRGERHKTQGQRIRWRLFGVVCAVCLAAVAAVGCASGGASEVTGAADALSAESTAAALAMPISWSEDSECAVCHSGESASAEDPACLASAHIPASVTCATCHNDTDRLSGVHSQVTYAMTDGRTALTTTTIDPQVCAGCHDVASLALATVVNPHALPANADHSTFTCTSCHKVHSTTAVATTAMRACTSCHHANVFECGTCHSVE